MVQTRLPRTFFELWRAATVSSKASTSVGLDTATFQRVWIRIDAGDCSDGAHALFKASMRSHTPVESTWHKEKYYFYRSLLEAMHLWWQYYIRIIRISCKRSVIAGLNHERDFLKLPSRVFVCVSVICVRACVTLSANSARTRLCGRLALSRGPWTGKQWFRCCEKEEVDGGNKRSGLQAIFDVDRRLGAGLHMSKRYDRIGEYAMTLFLHVCVDLLDFFCFNYLRFRIPFWCRLVLDLVDLIASGSTSKILIVVVAAISVSELLSKGAVSAVMTLSGELTSELLLRLLIVEGVVDAFTFV